MAAAAVVLVVVPGRAAGSCGGSSSGGQQKAKKRRKPVAARRNNADRKKNAICHQGGCVKEEGKEKRDTFAQGGPGEGGVEDEVLVGVDEEYVGAGRRAPVPQQRHVLVQPLPVAVAAGERGKGGREAWCLARGMVRWGGVRVSESGGARALDEEGQPALLGEGAQVPATRITAAAAVGGE